MCIKFVCLTQVFGLETKLALCTKVGCIYIQMYIYTQALNHTGICVSYTTAWKYLRQLTEEAKYLDKVRDGHWIWIYDNLNLLQSARHEREGT